MGDELKELMTELSNLQAARDPAVITDQRGCISWTSGTIHSHLDKGLGAIALRLKAPTARTSYECSAYLRLKMTKTKLQSRTAPDERTEPSDNVTDSRNHRPSAGPGRCSAEHAYAQTSAGAGRRSGILS